jgi:hypothetical protein
VTASKSVLGSGTAVIAMGTAVIVATLKVSGRPVDRARSVTRSVGGC